MPAVFGTPGDDNLTGTTGDSLFGDAGNDTLILYAGGSAYGEAGDDILIPAVTSQQFYGRNAVEMLNGGDGYDTIDGSFLRFDVPAHQFYQYYFEWRVNAVTGEPELVYAYRDPTLLNIPGFDPVTVTARTQTASIERILLGNQELINLGALTRSIEIVGNAGANTISGGQGADILRGGAGDDTITVGAGDRAYGDAGRDTFLLGWTSPPVLATAIDGGEGFDTLAATTTGGRFELVITNAGFAIGQAVFTSIEAVTVTASTTDTAPQVVNISGSDAAETFTYSQQIVRTGSRVTFLGGAGNDVLTTSGTTDDRLEGGAGNDTIRGSGLLSGGDGDDMITGFGVLSGGAGSDRLSGSGDFHGDTGDDVVTVTTYVQGSVIDGGDGVDSLVMNTFQNPGNVISLSAGTVAVGSMTGTITGIENVTGGTAADRIEGNGANNVLIGLAGDDTLSGLGGDDRLDGGAGADILDGGAGADRLDGGDGDDRLSGGDGDDVLVGGVGSDVLNGGDGADILDAGAGVDQLSAGAGDDRITGGAGDDAIDGGEGDDIAIFNVNRADAVITRDGAVFTVRSTDGLDTVTRVEHLQFLDGIYDVGPNGELSAQARAITGTANADRLTGTAAIDILRGGAGDDILFGGGGNDGLDGGDGIDTAQYAGLRRQYVADSSSVSGNGEGRDALTGIENLAFVDGVLTFDANSRSAQVVRLYDAVLNRQPDQAGLEAGVANLASMSLTQLAASLMTSTEFQSRFGGLDNQRFVESLYQSAFGRDGDTGGIAAWTAALNAGTSRATVIISFSESAENQGQTRDALNAGLWIPDAEAKIIARLYDATFDRLPDPTGLAGWVNYLDGGMSLQQIAGAFAGSAEFQQRYGALSNQQFVEQLYRFCLDREGDAGGISGWVGFLNGGMTRAQVSLQFSESPEHTALTAASWLGGIRYQGSVGAPVEDVDGKEAGPMVSPLMHDEAVSLHFDAGDAAQGGPFTDDVLTVTHAAAAIDAHVALFAAWSAPDGAVPEIVAGLEGLMPDDLSAGHRHSDWM